MNIRIGEYSSLLQTLAKRGAVFITSQSPNTARRAATFAIPTAILLKSGKATRGSLTAKRNDNESIGDGHAAQICFFVSIVFSFVAWGAVTGSLIVPELRRRGRNEALRPLLMFHSFRFVGLAFLVPGVVSPDLPAAFAEGAAYGDIVAAALALLTLALLPGRLGIVAAWVFNLWGSADILHANYQGIHLGVQAGQLGAAYFLPTFIVPLFLITHGLMFWLLLRNENEAAVPAARRLA